MVEFTDRDSVKAWAEGRTVEEFAHFAGRAAARVLPLAESGSPAQGFTDLAVARAILTTLVRGVHPTTEIREAASDAAAAAAETDAAFAGFSAATNAAHAAAVAAYAAVNSYADPEAAVAISYFRSDNPDAFYFTSESTAEDATALEEGQGVEGLARRPLWQGQAIPEEVEPRWRRLRERWAAEPQTWGFWIDWYEGLLEGRAPDWELWRDVALIDGAHWQEGPEAVAREIGKIRRQHRTRVVPPLVFDETRRVYHIAEEPPLAGDTLQFAKERAEMLLANALDASSNNGFTEDSYEAISVRRALAGPQSPSVIATAFYDAVLALSSNIGELYPDDASLVNLKNGLYAVVEEICELSEDAQKRCARIASLEIGRRPTADERRDLDKLVDVAAPAADAKTQQVLRVDAGLIAWATRAPKWVKARFLNYMTTLASYLDRIKKGDDRIGWLIRRLDDLWDWFRDMGE